MDYYFIMQSNQILATEYLNFMHVRDDIYHVCINETFLNLLKTNDVCLIQVTLDENDIKRGEPLICFETTKTVYEIDAPFTLTIIERFDVTIAKLKLDTKLITVNIMENL